MKDYSAYLLLFYWFGVLAFTVGFSQFLYEAGFGPIASAFMPMGLALILWLPIFMPTYRAKESRPSRRNNRRLTPKGARR